MNKAIETTAKVLTGVGALNWGTSMLGFDLLKYVPAGMWKTVAVTVIAASGAWVIWATYKKQI